MKGTLAHEPSAKQQRDIAMPPYEARVGVLFWSNDQGTVPIVYFYFNYFMIVYST